MKKAEIDEILKPVDLVVVADRETKVRGGFWSKLTRFAGRVPFSEDLAAAYFCAMDPNTPTRVRGVLLAALAYFILPADTIPDILIGLGFSDDLAVLTAAWAAVSGHITDEHRQAGREALALEPDQTKAQE